MTARRAVLVAAGVPCLLVLLATGAAAQGVQLDTAGPGTAVGLWVARLVNHLSLAAAVGLLLVPAWLLRDAEPSPIGRRAARLAAVAALVWGLSALAVLVFGLSNAAARALPEVLGAGLMDRFLDTRFGAAVAVQGIAAVVVAGLAVTARDRATSSVALLGALLAAAAPAWWGHAGTADAQVVAVLSTWLHIGAASVWVGGLLAVTVLVLGSRSEVAPLAPTMRFSALAGWAVLAVAVTGVVNTVLQTSAISQLVDTTWGRLALAKSLLLLGLAAFGWAHRRRSIPLLRTAGGAASSRRLFVRIAAVELIVMLGAFGLATTMASGIPAEAEAAARIQTFTVPLGEGLVEVTLDPARAGRTNEVHVYVYAADRSLRPFDELTLELRTGDVVVEPRLFDTGPGHRTGPAVDLPVAGIYEATVRVTFDGDVEEATATLTVR